LILIRKVVFLSMTFYSFWIKPKVRQQFVKD